MDTITLGKTAINGDYPAGTDIRYEPSFEELQAEIDKLASPTASGGINWQRVNDLAEKILSDESKDLLVGSYFAVSRIYIADVEGLTTGIQVFRDLLETFWDTMFPKKKRMRGRVAAVEWWVEKSATALELLNLQSIEKQKKAALLAECDHLKQLCDDLFPEPPALAMLARVIKSLPAKKDTAKPPVLEQAPEKIDTPNASSQHTAIVNKQSNPAPTPQTNLPIGSSDEAVKAIQSLNNTIKRAALGLVEHDPTNPFGHRSLRTAVWSNLDSLPQAIDNKTIIPPPEPYIITVLQDLLSRKDWVNLALAAENHFAQYIFWLDLQRHCATSLDNLGQPYEKASESVCQETSSLLQRMPELINLQFADGSPFADKKTQEWCQGLETVGNSMDLAPILASAEGSAEEANQLHRAIQRAGELIKERKLTDAVELIQNGIRDAHSARESMQWRLALVRLLIGAKKAEIALSHCEKLAKESDHYNLECWDPGQALIIYKSFYHCLKTISSKLLKERGKELLNKIAELDSAEAIRMSS